MKNPKEMHLQLTYSTWYLLDQLTLHLPVYMHTHVFEICNKLIQTH